MNLSSIIRLFCAFGFKTDWNKWYDGGIADMAPGATMTMPATFPAATFAMTTTTTPPGGAGERGPSGGGGGGALKQPERVRSNFLESWIWADLETSWYKTT